MNDNNHAMAPPQTQAEKDAEELALMKSCGVIEIAVRNPNVWLYMDECAARLIAQAAEIERLRGFVQDFADAKFDEIRQGFHGSPADEPDAICDAATVWAWQDDARETLKGGAE